MMEYYEFRIKVCGTLVRVDLSFGPTKKQRKTGHIIIIINHPPVAFFGKNDNHMEGRQTYNMENMM